jgi:putative transposase
MGRKRLWKPGSRRQKHKPLGTIWQVPDELWERIEPILFDAFPPRWTGRPRKNWRRIFNGIIFQMRTGCQWNVLPRGFGDDSTIHRWFTRWCDAGVFEKIWEMLAAECDELGAVHWEWQSVDACMGKARMGGDQIGENPTDRAKKGTKKSILVEQEGGPLAVTLAPANRHDSKLLRDTLEAIVIDRPEPTRKNKQHLCLDKAYDNEAS